MPPGLMRDTIIDTDPGAAGEFWNPKLHDSSNPGVDVEFYYNKVAEADYVRIRFPADKLKVWDQPVREEDKIVYRAQWLAYQAGEDQLAGQTRLQDWAPCDEGSRRIYNEAYIYTVEQLAALPDANFSAFPTGHGRLARRHREMAKEFVAEQRLQSGAQAAMSEAEAARADNAKLQEALQLLTAKVEQLQAAQPANPAPASPVSPLPVPEPPVEQAPVEQAATPPAGVMQGVASPAPESAFPRRIDTGDKRRYWYELSDGRRIQGKAKAIAAQEDIDKAAKAA